MSSYGLLCIAKGNLQIELKLEIEVQVKKLGINLYVINFLTAIRRFFTTPVLRSDDGSINGDWE
jgi:hypothetical protein